jgi:co-chaperonin GroES (HSP10)
MTTNADRDMGKLEKGDKVVFRRYGGDAFRIKDDPDDFLYRLLTDSEIEMILQEGVEVQYED